jgi:hypothetical protein
MDLMLSSCTDPSLSIIARDFDSQFNIYLADIHEKSLKYSHFITLLFKKSLHLQFWSEVNIFNT